MKNSVVNKKYDEFEKKLDSLINITFEEFNMIYSNSSVVNTIINSRLSSLQKYRIRINSVVQYNEFYFIESSDLIDLLYILIDFGIAICKEVDDLNRVIVLKTFIRNSKVIVQTKIIFNKESEINQIIKKYESELKNIVYKYKGRLSININNDVISTIITF